MGVAALYDLALAAAILAFPRPSGRWLGLDVPADPLHFRLNGVLLVLLAAIYLLPARDPVRYQGVAAISAAGRLAGAAYLGGAYWHRGGPPSLLGLSALDLAFAGAQTILLVAAWRGGPRQVPDRAGP